MKDDRSASLFMTELAVRDLPQAIAWYVDILLLHVELVDEGRGFALLSAGVGRLALKQQDDARISGLRLVFQVADIEAEARRLRERIPDLSGVVDDPEGFRSLKLLDCEGTPITLFAWAKSLD